MLASLLFWLIVDRRFHAKNFMQFRRSRRLLHMNFLFRKSSRGRTNGVRAVSCIPDKAGADWHGRNVVNRFVGVKFNALIANRRQRVDHVRLDLQQPEFKHLK